MTVEELQALPYADYLKTEHWQTVRRLAMERADWRCQLCDSEGAEVHHRTYVRRGCELLRDLVVLCPACHGRHHGTLAGLDNLTTLIDQLKSELAAELRGAQFLASQIKQAWLDGVEEGKRQAKTSRRKRAA